MKETYSLYKRKVICNHSTQLTLYCLASKPGPDGTVPPVTADLLIDITANVELELTEEAHFDKAFPK